MGTAAFTRVGTIWVRTFASGTNLHEDDLAPRDGTNASLHQFKVIGITLGREVDQRSDSLFLQNFRKTALRIYYFYKTMEVCRLKWRQFIRDSPSVLSLPDRHG